MDQLPKIFVKPAGYKNTNHSQTIFISHQSQYKFNTLQIESPCSML